MEGMPEFFAYKDEFGPVYDHWFSHLWSLQDSPESVLHGLWSCREVDIVGQMRSYGVFGQVCISTILKIL